MDDSWLEMAYEDRTHVDDEGDWWDEYMSDWCRDCGEHFIDCMCGTDE